MKIKHFLIAALAVMGGSVFAQNLTGNTVAAGDYYLYNVATETYLCSGNEWGSHASVAPYGMPITLVGSGDTYSLSTAYYYTGKSLNGEWMDGDAYNWTFTAVDAETYTISNGANYLRTEATGTRVVSNADAINENCYWKLITKQQRVDAMASATPANPQDVTFLVGNSYFAKGIGMAIGKNIVPKYWEGTTVNDYWGVDAGNVTACYAVEMYDKTFELYQALTNLPVGVYEVSAQAFQRGSQVAYLYANKASNLLCNIEDGGEVPTNIGTAASAFLNGRYNVTPVHTNSLDGNLRIGFKKETNVSADWVAFDNVKVMYLGTQLVNVAVALPNDGVMAADTWYYVEIPTAGDYNFNATTAASVIYTTDGEQFTANGFTGTAIPTVPTALTVGRLYVKSSVANTLEVAPNSYVYEVGAPVLSTPDGKYTQSSTLTVTFPAAATNDPEAAAALVAGAQATVNGTPVALSAIAGGFSLDLGTIAPAQDFVVAIPAGIYGYAGETLNEAINATVHTPVVFDGGYYVKASDGRYLSRGNNYNTRAVVDNYGIGLRVVTNADNITTLQFVDNSKYLFDANGGNIYTDNTNNRNWTVVAVAGGVNIVNQNTTGNSTFGQSIVIDAANNLVCSASEAELFTFEPAAEHAAAMVAVKDAQAAAVAAAAGLSATSVAELEAYLASCVTENVTIPTPIAAGEAYQKDGMDVNTTLTGLQNGLYVVSAQAYHRILGHAAAWALRQEGLENPTAYLYANAEQSQLCSLFDQVNPSDTKRHGNDVLYGGYYYPDRTAGGDAAFAAGNYVNKVYVNVTDGTLKIGIANKPKVQSADWIYYANFKVEKVLTGATLELVATDGDNYYATFSSEKVVEFEDATVYTVNVENGSLSLTEVVSKQVPANTGVLVKTTATTAAYSYIPSAAALGENMLRPASVAMDANDYEYFKLAYGDWTNKTGLGFYWGAENGAAFTCKAGGAYLAVPASALSGEFRGWSFDEMENGHQTAISVIPSNSANEGACYDLYGRRVNGKGLMIQNGKVVLVK